MRKITLLVVHCSATVEGRDYTVGDIDRWHKARGFGCQGIHIGYHYVVYRDGSIHRGRPDEMVGSHVKDHNRHSIGICYIGGLRAASPSAVRDGSGASSGAGYVPADTRTPEQKTALHELLSDLKQRYPGAVIVGHHDLNPQKSCPCFDAAHEYINL